MTSQSPRQPQHQIIYQEIYDAIQSGKYGYGDQLPTDGALMRSYDVSRPTVARAMRDLEQKGIVTRRPGSGTFVNVAPEEELTRIGLLIPGLGDTEIFESICGEIARICTKKNYNLLWSDPGSGTDEWSESALQEQAQRYIDQRVSGVFFAPVEWHPELLSTNVKVATQLRKAGIAVILLDRDLEPFPNRSSFDLVGIDNFRAGYKQAEHLIQQGCTNIVYVALPYSAPTVDLRIKGYRSALRNASITVTDDMAHFGDPADEGFLYSLIQAEPEGIICANDATAMALYKSLTSQGIRIPEDVLLMGMDDSKYTDFLPAPLSTLRQPTRAMGAAAMEIMQKRIENADLAPCNFVLDTELIVRESTKRN
ncbi:MAG: GntR family transcriptional regulator [Puniceicoccaceae bacterium]